MKVQLRNCFNYKAKGVSSVIGGFILHLVLGGFYLWASINLYFTSYFRLISDPELQTSKSVIVNTIIDILGSLTMFSASFFIGKLGLRGTCFTFGFVISLSVFLCSFMPSFVTFTAMFGIPFGFSFGILWISPISNIYQYFPQRKGLFSGIILCGIGVGTLIANFIAQSSINPNNETAVFLNENEQYFDTAIAMNFPYGMRILSLYFLLITIIATLLIFPHSKTEETFDGEIEFSETQHTRKLIEDNQTESLIQKNKLKPLHNYEAGKSKEPIGFKRAMKTFFPYALYLMNTLSWISCYILANNLKNYGILRIADDQFLTIVGSICGIFNGLSRICCGMLGDRLGYRKMWNILMAFQTIFFITLPFISSEKLLYLLWSSILFCSLGGQVPLLPAYTAEFYDERTASDVFAFVAMGFPSGNLIQYIIVVTASPSIGLGPMFYIAGATSLASLILNMAMKVPEKEVRAL